MEDKSQLIVVDANILPDVFTKVLEVKKLMARKDEKSFASACKRIGISRSAYYKYKDAVFEYSSTLGETVSLQAELRDKAGVLSAFLQQLYSFQANLLTVNQGLPVDGIASFSVSFRIPSEDFDPEVMLNELSEIDGVISVKRIHGE